MISTQPVSQSLFVGLAFSVERKTARGNNVEKCPEHQTVSTQLEDMHNDVREILRRLGTGDVSFATLDLRVNNLEKVVYGALGVSLTALVMAVIGLVMKG
jgi:hypothetical protein